MSTLRIRDFSVQVRLGCLDSERLGTQEVRFSIELRYPSAPRGATSDRLDDTLNYADVCAAVRTVAESRHFDLVESLARAVSVAVEKLLPPETAGKVCVHKVNVPVDGLLGGVIYEESIGNES